MNTYSTRRLTGPNLRSLPFSGAKRVLDSCEGVNPSQDLTLEASPSQELSIVSSDWHPSSAAAALVRARCLLRAGKREEGLAALR